MVNNFPLFWRLVGGVLNLCYYACMNALTSQRCTVKNSFYARVQFEVAN